MRTSHVFSAFVVVVTLACSSKSADPKTDSNESHLTQTQVSCCYNGQSFACANQTQCLGYDLQGCLAHCAGNVGCIQGCTSQKPTSPVGRCARDTANDSQCSGGSSGGTGGLGGATGGTGNDGTGDDDTGDGTGGGSIPDPFADAGSDPWGGWGGFW
jgi:hypothetical protein